MMKVAVFLVLSSVCLSALADEPNVLSVVQQEKFLSREYIDALLAIQRSTSSIQAATHLLSHLKATGDVPTPVGQNNFVEDSDDSDDSDDYPEVRRSYLEIDNVYGNPWGAAANNYGAANYGAPNYGAAFPGYGAAQQGVYGQPAEAQRQLTPDQDRLMFAYTLIYATKLKNYQTIFSSADVANEFWIDRYNQLIIQNAQATGTEVPAAVLQFLFVKLYHTNLKTLKLSLTFQYLSHFNSWLEDELDVYGEHATLEAAQATHFDQRDDLIRDKIFAFSAYNSFAQIDFQAFYFELFLETVISGGSLAQVNSGNVAADVAANSANTASTPTTESNPNTASFLEEGSQFTDVLATGSFGVGQQVAPYAFTKVYDFYHLLFQLYAANSGLSAAYAEHQAYTLSTDNNAANDGQIPGFSQITDRTLNTFANNLLYSSQMEYVAALYKLFILFSPVLAGSFGGSLGSLAGSLGSL